MQIMAFGRFLLIRIVQNYSRLVPPSVVIDLFHLPYGIHSTSKIFKIEIGRITEEARNVQDDKVVWLSDLEEHYY